jgi:hypothetical protein
MAAGALLVPSQLRGQTVSAQSPSAASAGQAGCEVYFTVQPIDLATLKLLSTPIAPVNRTVFADTAIRQLQAWDLPSKVTAWRERPSPQELARQWDELDNKYSSGSHTKDKSKDSVPRGHAAPYGAAPLPAREWQDFEKWFAKNAPKKLSGACVDSVKATYVVALGMVWGGAAVTTSDPNQSSAYNNYATKPQADALGPGAPKLSTYQTPSNELEVAGMTNGGSGSTCVYFYRTDGKGIGEGGIRQATPEYYYCHEGSGISQSTVSTLLKFLAKSGLPPATPQ